MTRAQQEAPAAKNQLIDLTGKTFGIWRVLEQAPRRDNKTRWLCECTECGGRLSLRSTVLRSAKYAKCFGTHRDRKRPTKPSHLQKPPGYAAATAAYHQYKTMARSRGFPFELTRNEAVEIMGQNCHYCGMSPSNRSRRSYYNGDFLYNGIDRKDSHQGYVNGNCLPSCGTCNVMKQDLRYEDFLAHIHAIARYHDCPSDGIAGSRMGVARMIGNKVRVAHIETSW